MSSLFSINQSHLDTGMRGFPIGYCMTSKVDPKEGLFYRGIPITECVQKLPEEIIYLLVHGYEPSSEELEAFSADLTQRSSIKQEVLDSIRQLPRNAHPMELFSTALMLLGMHEAKGDYREDALNVIAKLPELAACVINHHAGWQHSQKTACNQGYIANFTEMLGSNGIDKKILQNVFNHFAILHFDHGGGNLSTFVGKAVSSSLEDMYASLSSAMNALAGPRHGRANQNCLEFVREIHAELGANPSQEHLQNIIENKLQAGDLIYGFGHPVLRVEDPRATFLYEIAEKQFADNPLVQTALMMRKAVPEILSKNPKITNPYPNVDAISGVVLEAAGFPHAEYYTVLFGMARCVGIAEQIVYERCIARDGKGVPIYRPKYLYQELLDTTKVA